MRSSIVSMISLLVLLFMISFGVSLSHATAPTYSWTGFAVNQTGIGLGGIPVTLHIMSNDSNGTPYEVYNMTVMTNSSPPFIGQFEFDNIIINPSVNAPYGYFEAVARSDDNQTIYGKTVNFSMNQPPPGIGIVLNMPTYHTFSVYGHVQYDNGSSISGTTIRLIEPVNNTPPIVEGSFSYMVPAIQSTITDNNGDFRFINVTTNYSTLGLDVEYPAAHPANPQEVYVGRDKVPVNTSGVQYVNITRWATQNSDLPLSPLSNAAPTTYLPPLSPPSERIPIIIGVGAVCLFGLFCLYKALYHKK